MSPKDQAISKTTPRYDVAISFLARDEPIAAALATRLTGGLKVFFYPRNQEEVAGTDGLESMRFPFQTESRINVVLFRDAYDDSMLKGIRELRNRLTGHPAHAGEREKPRRLSSAIIVSRDIRPNSFSGYIYYEDTGKPVTINVAAILQDNETQLVRQMQNIEVQMDTRERKFRAKHARRPLLDNFGAGFGYLLEKLHCDISDHSRVVQARSHLKMICEVITRLQKDLVARDFEPTDAAYHIDLMFTALRFMARTLDKKTHSGDDQNMYYLVLDGFEKHLDDLTSIIREVDARLKTAIH